MQRGKKRAVHPEAEVSPSKIARIDSEEHDKIELLLKAIKDHDLVLLDSMLKQFNHKAKNAKDVLTSALHDAVFAQNEAAVNALCRFAREYNIAILINLRQAASLGNANIVKVLLRLVANVNFVSKEDGKTALIVAAGAGRVEVVNVLLNRKGVDVNCVDNNGSTALFAAAHCGNEKIVEALLIAGANHKILYKGKFSALRVAAQEGHINVVNLLLRAGGVNDVGSDQITALMVAATKGHLAVVKLLLKHEGINVNCVNTHGFTALIAAVLSGHENIVEELLDARADHRIVYKGNLPALSLAVEKGYINIVNVLLKHGADVDFVSAHDNSTVLTIAAKKGYVDIVKLLLPYKPKINFISGDGKTVLMQAAENGHAKVIEVLLEQSNIHINSSKYETALMCAARGGHLEAVRVLSTRSEINYINNADGKTALIYAIEEGHLHVVEFLLNSCGAKSCMFDDGNKTPFIVAAEKGHVEIVKLLLQKGPDNFLKQKNGVVRYMSYSVQVSRAMMFAAMNGHDKVQELLVKSDFARYVMHNLTDVDKNIDKPLHIAVRYNKLEMVKILITAQLKGTVNATLDLLDVNCKTPLMLAVELGCVDIARELLKSGADVNFTYGKNALILAVINGSEELVEVLLNAGAKIDEEVHEFKSFYSKNATALHYAVYGKHINIARKLFAYNANVRKDIQVELLSFCLQFFYPSLEMLDLLLHSLCFSGKAMNEAMLKVELFNSQAKFLKVLKQCFVATFDLEYTVNLGYGFVSSRDFTFLHACNKYEFADKKYSEKIIDAVKSNKFILELNFNLVSCGGVKTQMLVFGLQEILNQNYVGVNKLLDDICENFSRYKKWEISSPPEVPLYLYKYFIETEGILLKLAGARGEEEISNMRNNFDILKMNYGIVLGIVKVSAKVSTVVELMSSQMMIKIFSYLSDDDIKLSWKDIAIRNKDKFIDSLRIECTQNISPETVELLKNSMELMTDQLCILLNEYLTDLIRLVENGRITKDAFECALSTVQKDIFSDENLKKINSFIDKNMLDVIDKFPTDPLNNELRSILRANLKNVRDRYPLEKKKGSPLLVQATSHQADVLNVAGVGSVVVMVDRSACGAAATPEEIAARKRARSDADATKGQLALELVGSSGSHNRRRLT